MRIVFRSLLMLGLFSVVALQGIRGDSKSEITPEQIEKAISQLADKRFAVREKANKFLWEAGSKAEKALQEATKSTDPEVASRAQTILDNFAWGVYPDSDPKLKEQIETYKKGDRPTRLIALENLLKLRPVPFKSLRKVIAREDDGDSRREQLSRLIDYGRTVIPELIRDDKLDDVEETLELLLTGSSGELAGDYAAFMLMRNKVDVGIARFAKLADEKEEVGRVARHVLLYLHRIKGDHLGALKFVDEKAQIDLAEGLLAETGNWKELAKRNTRGESGTNDIGFRLMIARLAEDTTKVDEILKELRNPKEQVETDPERNRRYAEAFLLNGFPKEGIKILLDSRSELDMAFELLVAQMRYKEALALLDATEKLKPENPEQAASISRDRIQLHRARVLHLLGEKDAALQLFITFAERFKDPAGFNMAYALLRTEMRLGLKELAQEHLLLLPKQPRERGGASISSDLLELIFPKQGPLATRVWAVLDQAFPGETDTKLLKRLSAFLAGEAKDDLPKLVKLLDKPIADPVRPPNEGEIQLNDIFELAQGGNHLTALAELYALHRDDENARKYFKKAAPDYTGVNIPFGDYLFEKGKFLEAAEVYGKEGKQGERTAANNVLAVYLQGRSLVKAGKKQEGEKLIERAFWMPLANEYIRSSLMDELRKRDWPEAARREAEMLLRCGDIGTSNAFAALGYLAPQMGREKKFAQTGDYYQRIVLGLMRIGVHFSESSGYISVPETIRLARGQQLLKEGKLKEALEIAQTCIANQPGNIDVVLAYVSELDRLKKTKEADAIYHPVRDAYVNMLKEYPDSAFACNSLAWMMSNIRRDLDDALKHAERAVKLEPHNTSYLDTLGEVHFRRGEKAKAVAAMKKCIAAEPKRIYFWKQLQRFETQGPDSDPPDEHEEE